MIRHTFATCAVVGFVVTTAAQAPPPAVTPSTIPRFAREPNPIALSGPARPQRYLEASGRRAAFLGREDGSFEAWVYPLKVLHGFDLSFGTPSYASPIPGSDLASWVDVRPEATVVRYAHESFTADATWLVPQDQPGGLVLLDIRTSVPLQITVKFRIDLKPMWPAALGGQSSYWDAGVKAYVAGEASRKHAALIGSPLADTPPEQPAHNLPDAPSQFTIRITPDVAARGLIPIAIAASPDGVGAATQAYARVLASAESSYHEAAAHYRRLRDELTSIDTPDETVNLAFEWGKVALDKGFVCNPQLGCGLIAGLGPSGNTERPGFGWFFGGDAFMNAWAMTAYGDFGAVKQTLEFLRQRQRADGKMMHELSQGAAYVRWFEDFPYGYYHADTTALYIIAVRDYVRASGDTSFAKAFWPSIRKAYEYCASTDEDGDGLMDNTKAGLAAVETGKLRRADVLTDVYLASAWTEATEAAAEIAEISGDAFAASARAAHGKARASLNTRFLDDTAKRMHFAWMKSGRGDVEPSAWMAFGLWRGVFDASRPAVVATLDELAASGIGTDWGTRLLSRESEVYEPQSYNNGAVWPFLTGFTTLALYTHRRPDAAWQYLRAGAELAFIESRGYTPELLSGDRLRSLDQAVPHQLFSSSGFVSGVIRGLAGLREPSSTDAAAPLSLAPALPSGWSYMRLRRLHWRDGIYDVAISRDARGIDVSVSNAGRPHPILVTLPLEPGATIDTGAAAMRFAGSSGAETRRVTVRPGISIDPIEEPLKPGDPARRLRIIRTSFEDGRYVARVEGLRGRTYALRVRMPFDVAGVEGATVTADREGFLDLAVPFDGSGNGWLTRDLVIRTGRRR